MFSADFGYEGVGLHSSQSLQRRNGSFFVGAPTPFPQKARDPARAEVRLFPEPVGNFPSPLCSAGPASWSQVTSDPQAQSLGLGFPASLSPPTGVCSRGKAQAAAQLEG